MRHHFHRPPMRRRCFHRRPRLIFRRAYRRRGSLLGLIGLAALGYALVEKNRQNQTQGQVYSNADPNQDW